MSRSALVTACVLVITGFLHAVEPATRPADRIIGMYVHQHWPYNHPYAARTWTLDDWRGYADGLHRLGYNTIMVWPMLETMPDPLTPSDRAGLEKNAAVIRMLHEDFGMRVWLALCPNVGVNNEEAAKHALEQRHFFYCDTRVNPADPAAMEVLLQRREKLLKPLADADAVAIIDSDPGGYPGSTNAEFVNLLGEHRRMLDRLRPGIELVYWMHVGWEGYGRFYKTGRFSWGTPDEQTDALARLAKLDPAPWGIANGLPFAEKLGLAGKVVSFNYGRIEAEPSFPMTNYGGDAAYEGGRLATARGVMGNAQTHCVQLPNTFAFARGATGKPLNRDEYVRFADDLIVGQGALVVEAWEASAGTEAAVMRTVADRLAALRDDQLRPGSLKGLLFGSASRFVNDLVMQLRLRAALRDFCAAVEAGPPPREAVSAFLGAVEKWQHQHGYMNAWWWPELDTALRKLNAPAINSVLKTQFTLDFAPDPKSPLTPYEQLANCFRETETYTVRLMAAMKKTLETMP